MPQNTAIVIPCYNAGNRLESVLNGLTSFEGPVIVVDDGSTDGGTDCLSERTVQALRFPENRGKGHALLAGIREALQHEAVQRIVLMDADGQHDPGEVDALLSASRSTGAALVVGARQIDRRLMPLRSRFGNVLTAWISAHVFRCPLSDTQCGFRVLSRAFAESFLAQSRGGRYETEMEMILFALREGCVLASAPVATVYEPGNRSSHFRKIRDSFRIYRVLLWAWRR
ncbi:MAG TPA: glycosyltransferase family 2 protein [Candidatus Hydrogenedentes bacterium]|nr:glycosyltransferase family 2 protein [Candidatus Hydrogenedentota bacterium]